MATQTLTNSKLWMSEYDLSGDLNAIAADYGAELKDNTTFGDSTRSNQGGLKEAKMSLSGYWQSTPDAFLFNQIGVSGEPMTCSPQTGADGEVAFTMKALAGNYNPGGAVGDMFAFDVTGHASKSPMVRGTIMHNATRTASGNGTARQLGAVSSTQKLYCAIHVISASGTSPTLDVIVQSDDNGSMTTPVTVATFTQATGTTSEWVEVSGAITDDYLRVNYTLGGTSPSFEFIVILGIF